VDNFYLEAAAGVELDDEPDDDEELDLSELLEEPLDLSDDLDSPAGLESPAGLLVEESDELLDVSPPELDELALELFDASRLSLR
jgi:hypothetical protein